jgi:hypothetical protein
MSAHTPGPWRVMPPSVGRFKVGAARAHSEAFQIVGEASNYNEQAEANARLIAAAPELLEALQELVSHYMARNPPWLGKARAAIAKAEGKS